MTDERSAITLHSSEFRTVVAKLSAPVKRGGARLEVPDAVTGSMFHHGPRRTK